MSDAIRDQLIEAMAEGAWRWTFTQGFLLEATDMGWQHAPDDEKDQCRALVTDLLDALLAQRDSDGIPLVLGLIAEQVGVLADGEFFNIETWAQEEANDAEWYAEHGTLPHEAEVVAPVWVPRLSEDKPAQEEGMP